MRRRVRIPNYYLLEQEGKRMGTGLVLLILAGAIGLAVRSMIKDKKAGKSLQCGQDCSKCGGCCHAVKKQQRI